MTLSCEDTGTGPEHTGDLDVIVMADYAGIATGNWWRYEHMTTDSAKYGVQLEEYVGTPVTYESVVCHPYLHNTEAEAYPDTTFMDASNPLCIRGFAWRRKRFAYRPWYRLAADTMRIGDTLRFSYALGYADADTVLGDTSEVTVVVCGVEPSPLHTEHFPICLKLRVEEAGLVEERWLVERVGTVASRKLENGSLVLTERLASATLSGVSFVYR